MNKNEYPTGWDEQRVRAILDHYGRQSEDEAVAEYESALAAAAGSGESYGHFPPGGKLASEVAEATPEYDGDEGPQGDENS